MNICKQAFSQLWLYTNNIFVCRCYDKRAARQPNKPWIRGWCYDYHKQTIDIWVSTICLQIIIYIYRAIIYKQWRKRENFINIFRRLIFYYIEFFVAILEILQRYNILQRWNYGRCKYIVCRPDKRLYIFRILQHFATKVWNFTIFEMFFPGISFFVWIFQNTKLVYNANCLILLWTFDENSTSKTGLNQGK